MKKEIEVKAKAGNLKEIKTKLEALGCTFTEPIVQEDVIFVNYSGDFSDFKPGQNFLRIRKAKGKILFTLKQSVKNELDSIEKETEIADAEEMRGAIELMGYHEAVQVHKTRTKTKHNGWEICLDEVKGLGSFIEVESITDEDADKVQEELFAFLQTLGVSRDDRVLNGYDTLVYLKNK